MKIFMRKKYSAFIFVVILLVSLALCGSALAFNSIDNNIDDKSTGVTKTSIAEYVDNVEQMNEPLASEKLNDILTSITFSKYLSFSEFEEFIETHDTDVVQLQLRGLMDDGTRVTIFTVVDKDLQKIKAEIEAEAVTAEYRLIGITGFYALVDSNNLLAVETDNRTYLADTSGDQYFRNKSEQNSVKRNNLDTNSRAGMFPQTITWDLEDAGLMGIADK